MSQIESRPTISETHIDESPRGITWFFDRTGDPSILENYISNLTNRFQRNNDEYIENILSSVARNLDTDFSQNIIKQKINIIVDKNLEISEEQSECCICMEKKNKKYICKLNCSHTFCITCCDNIIQTKIKYRQNHVLCPLCRIEIIYVYVEHEENKLNFHV